MTDFLKDALLVKDGVIGDTSIYRLSTEAVSNEYFIVSEARTRALMAYPEIVGFDSYLSMTTSTAAALRFLGLSGDIDILTILRGGLNYPLEECCHKVRLTVRNINFLSCERNIVGKVVKGLDIKYKKLCYRKNVTLLIGDIFASGDTFRRCIKYVVDSFHQNSGSIDSIILFTIGGTRAISILERLAPEIRAVFPEFKGFKCIFYEGIFSVYEDKGVSGVNVPGIDFGWKGGVVAPEFREFILGDDDALLEKCIIYDGGARRYQIHEHIEEVLGYWDDLSRSDVSMSDFIDEKIGYPAPASYREWLRVNHYSELGDLSSIYEDEKSFRKNALKRQLRQVARNRYAEFKDTMTKYE